MIYHSLFICYAPLKDHFHTAQFLVFYMHHTTFTAFSILSNTSLPSILFTYIKSHVRQSLARNRRVEVLAESPRRVSRAGRRRVLARLLHDEALARYMFPLILEARNPFAARESLAGMEKKSRGAESFSGASAAGVLARGRVDLARIIFV